MNPFLEAALKYARAGQQVFPAVPSQKIPLTKHGCLDATIDEAQIHTWWERWPNANVAMATGKGIYAVDVDVSETGKYNGWEDLKEFPPLPKTVRQDTPRGGAHFFFRASNPPANKNKFRPGLDVRGKGFYVIMAPSIHPNGNRYQWAPGQGLGEIELAEFPDFLRPPVRPPWSAKPTPQVPMAPVGPANSDALQRASAYLATCDSAVQGQNGHSSLLWAASSIMYRFGLSDSEVYDLLVREYNPRCVPPWDLGVPKDEKDFRRKITEARKNPPAIVREWEQEEALERGEVNQVMRDGVSQMLGSFKTKQHAVGGESNRQQSPGKISYRTWTAQELVDAKFESRYLIEGMLIANQPCMIAGPRKGLKTSALIDLGVSLTKPGYFLGKFKVPKPVRIGIMTGENAMSTVQETYLRICKTAEADPRKLGVVISDQIPKITDPTHLQAIREWIVTHSLEALGIDPAYFAMPGADANNLFIQGERLRPISEICTELGVTLILCHHNRKNIADPYKIPELDDIAWAGFQEWARQWILLGRREPYVPGTGEHRMWLTAGGSAGHSSAWALDVSEGCQEDLRTWKTTIQLDSDARRADAEQRKQVKVMVERATYEEQCEKAWNFLRSKLPNGDTQTAIRKEISVNNERVKEIIKELLESGSIECCKVTVGNGQKCDGYQAVQESEDGDEDQGRLFVQAPG